MKKLISYIFPIYNEAGNIEILFSTISEVTSSLKEKYNFEYIFINDGSIDDSLSILLKLQRGHSNVRVIDFAKNYGHQLAVTAGIDYSKGDAVIIMDSDMQDPPSVSLELIKEWENGYDVVYAQRRSRKDSFLKKLTAKVFYRVLNKLSDINIPIDTGDFRLIDRKVVQALRKCPEHNRFLRGLVSYIGFKQKAVLFDREARHTGETGYSVKKMLKLAKDGLFGYSTAPIQFVTILGVILNTISTLGILAIIFVKIFEVRLFFTRELYIILATIVYFSSWQFIFIGLLGEYVARIYKEVQGRPLYIIDDIYE